MPAVACGFQSIAGGFAGLAWEIDLYAVKFSVELHAEESGVAGLLGLAFLLGGDAGGFWDKLNVSSMIFEAPEVVEIDVKIINHAVAVAVVV